MLEHLKHPIYIISDTENAEKFRRFATKTRICRKKAGKILNAILRPIDVKTWRKKD
jgi:hypothetical protein